MTDIEIVECDRCHDNVPSVETFLNVDDEILCNECSYGLVGEVTHEKCVECIEFRRLLAQWVVENKRLKLELEEWKAQSDAPQRLDHLQETESSPDQNSRMAYQKENRRGQQTSE